MTAIAIILLIVFGLAFITVVAFLEAVLLAMFGEEMDKMDNNNNNK